MGAKLKKSYLVVGHCDFITISEALDNGTTGTCALDLASKGSVTTETLRALTEAECGG
jgi:uncharacterized protein with GYD domain